LNHNEIFERNVDIIYELTLLHVNIDLKQLNVLFIKFDYNAIANIAIKIHFCRNECVQRLERKKSFNLTRVNNVIAIYNTFTTKTTSCVFLRNVTNNEKDENEIMIYCIVNTRIALSTFENQFRRH
jgi:hypothetical protein